MHWQMFIDLKSKTERRFANVLSLKVKYWVDFVDYHGCKVYSGEADSAIYGQDEFIDKI